MNDAVHIRPARPGDRPDWLALRSAFWADTPREDHEAEVRDILDDPAQAGALLALTEDGEVVGFAEVSLRAIAEGCRHTPVGYLEGWYVAPGWRGRGIGRRLVQAAETWARERGCREMASDTELHNTGSQAAHARLGYEEVERVVLFRKTLPVDTSTSPDP